MDPQQQQLKQLQDLFTNANDILIITREQPSIDGLSASLALYSILSGQRTVQGKQKRVVIAVSGRNGSQYSLLPGSDKIVSELGLRDLVIGVNGYTDNSIESVNWYVDRGRLNVVFKSNPAVPMQFDLKNLDPFYAGANFDVVVVLDTAAPTDLGNAYRQDPGMYAELPVVNISNQAQNSRFGRVNIVDENAPSISELAFQLTQILRYPLTVDAATLFLAGMTDATQNFQHKGAQTDAILQQLQTHNPRTIDIESVRKQGANQPLPVVQGVPSAGVGGGQAVPQQVPGFPATSAGMYPYPPMPYGAVPPQGAVPPYPAYGQYMQPGMPPQNIPGYYPQYMPQYPYPQTNPPQYPVSGFGSEVQQHAEESVQSSGSSPYIPDYETDYAPNEDVPSIQHDSMQQSSYIPTSDIQGFSHVEPSLYDPNLPLQAAYQATDYSQVDVSDKVQTPDFKNAPKVFEGSRER